MEFKTFLFYIFSVVLLLAALCVITVRNTVHAALFLILTFFSAACIWMLMEAEFLAIILVLIYVGALMVLFLFIVMMLDTNYNHRPKRLHSRHTFIAFIIGGLIILEIIAILLHSFLTLESSTLNVSHVTGDTKTLGMLLYTDYVFAFEIAAIILLLAIISAVALTLRDRKGVKCSMLKSIKINN